MAWTRSRADGESGFHEVHVLTCVSVGKKISDDFEEEATHVFEGQRFPETSLTSSPVFIFLSIMILCKKIAYYNGEVCRCIVFTQKQFSLCLFNIAMATHFTFTVSFQCGNTFNVS